MGLRQWWRRKFIQPAVQPTEEEQANLELWLESQRIHALQAAKDRDLAEEFGCDSLDELLKVIFSGVRDKSETPGQFTSFKGLGLGSALTSHYCVVKPCPHCWTLDAPKIVSKTVTPNWKPGDRIAEPGSLPAPKPIFVYSPNGENIEFSSVEDLDALIHSEEEMLRLQAFGRIDILKKVREKHFGVSEATGEDSPTGEEEAEEDPGERGDGWVD